VSAARSLSPSPLGADGGREQATRRLSARLAGTGAASGRARHALAVIPFALSIVFNTVHLAQNGYANTFYSAGVRSMLHSLHNFFFVSFDPGGLVTVDKPPLALWLQAASAKIFGFQPLSLLLPEALAGALTVLVLYWLLARRLGVLAGLAGATVLAVYPTFVAVSRDNGVDPLLILLMMLACAAAVRACETGRWRELLASAVLVGLAFNTKTLAAYLVVPSIALAYLLCAPHSLRRRVTQLLLAGVLMGAVSFAWIAAVEATPASKRPYVGSSTNNTELGLTFEYNGVGRVEGQNGGPNSVKALPGAYVPSKQLKHNPPGAVEAVRSNPAQLVAGLPALERPARISSSGPPRAKLPIPFGEAPSVVRLFGTGLGDQVAWLLPLAGIGLLALALLILTDRKPEVPEVSDASEASDASDASEDSETSEASEARDSQPANRALRRDPRLATLIVLGGWFLVEAAVLSLSKGIVHPYYVSALAPGTAAMAGAGVAALARLAQGPRRWWALTLGAAGVAASVVAEVVLMHRERYAQGFVPVLAVGAVACVALALVGRRASWPALGAALALLLVVPAGYASTTWLAPVQGTFPVAGPRELAGHGGVGLNEGDLAIDRALMLYVQSHGAGSRWELLTVSADAAAPYILMGMKAGALGGYSGTDQAVSGAELARLVARGQARYVLLGGEYSHRGGNGATQATLRACKQLTSSTWGSPVGYPYGLVLFDCAGRQQALAHT
jgi:4-amino-4-deoxy-L-arabinose transferase-like glycosyltransferase